MLKCEEVTTSWNCLLVVEQISGNVLEQRFLCKGQDFLRVYASAGWGVFYTSRHTRHTELWLIHNPVIKALWVRALHLPVAFRCGSSDCQNFVTAAVRVPVESLSLICIITNKNRSWSLMLLSLVLHDAADFDWWYIRYAAFPHWCAVLTQTKLATQEHVHALRAWNQLTHSFSNPSFSVPTWTVSLQLWDKLFFKVINNKIQSTGLQPAKWITSVAAKKPVGRAACMLSKKFY